MTTQSTGMSGKRSNSPLGTNKFAGNTLIQYFNELPYFTGLTSLPSSLFQSCTSLKECVIPEKFTSVPQAFFRYCSSLIKVDLPETITTINGFVFQGCTSLESITIPSSVTYIERACFNSCSNLTRITMLPTTPPGLYASTGSNGFIDHTPNTLRIYVPSGSVEAYKAADKWSSIASIILPIS